MVVSVASGKGGTGKTTLCANLAWLVSQEQGVLLLDCDVEEPDAHFYVRPDWEDEREVFVEVPRVDEECCDYCGACADFCHYNALAVVKEDVLVFDELCHACRGCAIACPRDCIEMVPRRLGIIRSGVKGNLRLRQGLLDVGEPMPIPIIDELKEGAGDEEITFLDSPPGTACPMVTTISGSDYCIMVSEPTPFGRHDLEIALEVAARLEVPCGVLINKSTGQDRIIDDVCRRRQVPVLGRLPFSRWAAELCSRGEILAEEDRGVRELLEGVLKEVAVCPQGSLPS